MHIYREMAVSVNHRIIHSDKVFEDESVHYEANVGKFSINEDMFSGGLFRVGTKRASFVPVTGKNVSFEYTSMVMHAVSSNEQCLFIQLDEDVDENTGEPVEGEETIVKIYPVDSATLNSLFVAMNEMSALNSSQNDENGEDYEEFEDDLPGELDAFD